MPTKTQISDIDEWVNEYSENLFNWAFHKTGYKELSEDLVQDTFVAAYQKLDTFKGNSQVKTWLFSILKNKISDHYRKKETHLEVNESSFLNSTDQNDLLAHFFNPEGTWKEGTSPLHWESLLDIEEENRQLNRRLQNCLNKLPNKWYYIINSKYIEEKKGKEICKELDISPTNYWQILH
jgi:RNA polymerase sigma factor (sigma-70 family)